MAIFNEISKEELRDELSRGSVRKRWPLRGMERIEINPQGVRIAHNLGVVPDNVTVLPLTHRGLTVLGWWCYAPPDSTNLYLKTSQRGWFLVSVVGG